MPEQKRANNRILGVQHSSSGWSQKGSLTNSDRWFSHKHTVVPPSLYGPRGEAW